MIQRQELITIPDGRIINQIHLIRGKKVMIDRALAALYGVETKVFNQAVKRNKKRFPPDFMFQLNKQEIDIWKSQIGISPDSRSHFVTLKRGQNIKYAPHVFTEQGVAMLSSVLNSERAILVNIQIIRTFTKLREILATHHDLRKKIEDMEKKYDSKFQAIFKLITHLLDEKEIPKKQIGF